MDNLVNCFGEKSRSFKNGCHASITKSSACFAKSLELRRRVPARPSKLFELGRITLSTSVRGQGVTLHEHRCHFLRLLLACYLVVLLLLSLSIFQPGLMGTSEKGELECFGWAAHDSSAILSPYKFKRRSLGPDDVALRVTHCGVCSGDLSWLQNHLGDAKYPMVPGHEVVGVVTEVGSNASRFKAGERVGIGFYLNSCQDCEFCNKDMENFCVNHPTSTFNGIDVDGSVTKGGFSNLIIAHQRFVLKIPNSLASDVAAPLLCAGITVYSPMVRHGMNQAGKHLGVIGLGGLGHMAVKFGKAFGLHVTVLSTSPRKKEEALTVLGADRFLVTANKAEVQAVANSLDFIIDTASAEHPLDLYLPLLKTGGVFVLVGAAKELKFTPFLVFGGMKIITGSAVGGIKQIQEMLEFCGEHGVAPMIETIPMDYINTALARLEKNDVRYRFVVDVEKSLKE